MIIYAPTKWTAYYGEGMSYSELSDAIRSSLGMKRAPRGMFEVTRRGQTWTYNGREKTVPESALRSAYSLTRDGRLQGTVNAWDMLAEKTFEPEPEFPVWDEPKPTEEFFNVEAPTTLTQPEPIGGGGSLDQIIRDIATATAQQVAANTVNEERVTEIVAAAVAEAKFPRPVNITIHAPNVEPVTLDRPVHEAFEKVMRWIQTGPVMLVGPTGSGKTRLAHDIAEALGVKFYLTGMTLSRGDLLGYDTPGGFRVPPFYAAFKGPDTLHLADEIDAWGANATLAFNASLSNGYGSFGDSPEPVKRGERTYDMAAANTAGYGADRVYCGRNQLDGATLNRYVKVEVGYDAALEERLAADHGAWLHKVWTVRENCKGVYDKHVISTRQLKRGIDDLNNGGSVEDCVETLLRGDMKQSDWDRIKP